MMQRRIFASLCALIGSTALGACSSSNDASLHVTNNSDFEIVDLRVTQVDNPDFGSNLLSDGPLQPGESIRIDVSCDTYDAELVDETGVTCDLHGIDLCLNDADWVITNDTCSNFSAAAKARAAAKAAGQTQAQATGSSAQATQAK